MCIFEPMISQTHRIPITDFLSLSGVLQDYLSGSLSDLFYSTPLSLEALDQNINQRKSFQHREVCAEVIRSQAEGFPIHVQQSANIELLNNKTTFTITTAHQTNLFGGPLYFIQKAVSTINACKRAKSHYPEYDFVPVYWLGSEDHDFEELNATYIQDKKIEWTNKQGGAFGRYNTSTLLPVMEELEEALGFSLHADVIKQLFRKAYLDHQTIAEATRYLLSQLLGAYGLVIIDGDDTRLKRLMIPLFERELVEQFAKPIVSSTSMQLEQLYNESQAHPREINLFYLDDNSRNRIVKEDNSYRVYNTSLKFSKQELLQELHNFPERFSPNVILRPVMQESVLPNIMYVGGGGELSYWLQLKGLFDGVGCPFPMLGLRDTAIYIQEKTQKKMRQLSLSYQDLSRNKQELIFQIVRQSSNQEIELGKQSIAIKQALEQVSEQAKQVDVTLLGSVEASKTRILKEIAKLESKFFRAEKRKHSIALLRLDAVLGAIYPEGSLQERRWNFATLYIEHGSAALEWMLQEFDLFDKTIKIAQE